jgi:hypothetical protein
VAKRPDCNTLIYDDQATILTNCEKILKVAKYLSKLARCYITANFSTTKVVEVKWSEVKWSEVIFDIQATILSKLWNDLCFRWSDFYTLLLFPLATKYSLR